MSSIPRNMYVGQSPNGVIPIGGETIEGMFTEQDRR